MSDERIPLRIQSGASGFAGYRGELYVAVWRRHRNHKGEPYDDIDEELYATRDEWREIIRQISALLEQT